MSKPFRFKQFSVQQDRCAMKVGTDGVLLGAWAKSVEQPLHILDIGTGTGVIALMLAQRFAKAKVLGIDIESEAVLQASENFRQAPFSDRLQARCTSLQAFQASCKFACIVSNPPFFTDGVLPENTQRKLARHTTNFSFEMLFEKVAGMLSVSGLFSMIVPIHDHQELICIAKRYALYCKEACIVYPNPEKPAKRILLAFCLGKTAPTVVEELTIETMQRHHYTTSYRALLTDFYLAF